MDSIRFAVIDDAAFIRELIIANLKSSGHVCVAESGNIADGITQIMKTLPQVVFLDLVMPGRNGIDGARMIKDVWPEVKIILCTTVDQKELLQKSKDNGVDFIVEKPFEKSDLLNAIATVLKENQKGASV